MAPTSLLACCMTGVVVALVVAPRPVASLGIVCPPLHYDSVNNLDLAKFFAGEWYVQMQVR